MIHGVSGDFVVDDLEVVDESSGFTEEYLADALARVMERRWKNAEEGRRALGGRFCSVVRRPLPHSRPTAFGAEVRMGNFR